MSSHSYFIRTLILYSVRVKYVWWSLVICANSHMGHNSVSKTLSLSSSVVSLPLSHTHTHTISVSFLPLPGDVPAISMHILLACCHGNHFRDAHPRNPQKTAHILTRWLSQTEKRWKRGAERGWGTNFFLKVKHTYIHSWVQSFKCDQCFGIFSKIWHSKYVIRITGMQNKFEYEFTGYYKWKTQNTQKMRAEWMDTSLSKWKFMRFQTHLTFCMGYKR